MKDKIINILISELEGKNVDIPRLLEVPPTSDLGDFSFPCFSLAKIEKKSPLLIAEELAEKIRKKLTKKTMISNVDAKAGYVNFFIDKKDFVEGVLSKILKEKGKYGQGKEKLKIMIEFPSPNTNKPLHLGHLRNMSIGDSISRILEFEGNKIIRVNLNNDRGVHICKSMWAYEKYGKNKTPETEKIKSDHFVGDFYVLFSKSEKENPKLAEEAQEMLIKWENGDKKINSLWEKMNSWALNGFKETYNLFGLPKFDKEYYESDIYKKGKEMIAEGLRKGIFKKNKEGAIVADLEKEGLGEKVVLRADGTSIYITQDMYLAKLKDKEFKLDGSIYVVANEQNYHFQVLFNILKKFEFNFSNLLKHLSYGMVLLPEGRMKSREGTVVDADDLILETQKLAKNDLEKRYKLDKKDLQERSLKIALAAIKYFLLRIDITKDMVFNPNEAINFDGNTGPYLLYSYARANSIIKKVNKKSTKIKIVDLKESEIDLIKKLGDFPEIIKKSYNDLAPNLIANYIYDLSQLFNTFYHECPVLGSEEETFRIKIVEAFKIVMKSGLNLLGIKEIEEM